MRRSLVIFGLQLGFLLLTLALPAKVSAERPDVQWMRSGYFSRVDSIDYSLDGQLFASISDATDAVKIWRISDGMLLRTIKVTAPNFTRITEVRFTPDSLHVIFTGLENSTGVYKVARVSDGTIILTFGNNISILGTMQVLNDGTLVDQTQGFAIYRISDGVLLRNITTITYLDNNGMPQNFGTPPTFFGGTQVVTKTGLILTTVNRLGGGQVATIINTEGRVIGWHNQFFSFRDITPHGTMVFIGLSAYRVSDLCTQLPPCNPPAAFPIPGQLAYAFSPDSQILAIAIGGGGSSPPITSINLYRTTEGSLIRSLTTPQRPGLNPFKILFSPDSQVLAAGTFGPSGDIFPLVLWRVSDGTQISPRVGYGSHHGLVTGVAFSPDGQTLASISHLDKTVRLWRTSDGSLVRSFATNTTSSTVVFSPNGQYILTTPLTRFGGATELWRSSDGSFVRQIDGVAARFSVDGQNVITATSSGSEARISISDVETGKVLRSFNMYFAPNGFQGALAVSPDNQTIAFKFNHFVRIVRLSDGAVLRELMFRATFTDEKGAQGLTFSPDGQSLVAWGWAEPLNTTVHQIKEWRVSDGLPLPSYSENIPPVGSASFSYRGDLLVSGGQDGIRIWRTADRSLAKYYDEETAFFIPAAPPDQQFSSVGSVTFSPDGRKLAYGRQDSTAVMARNPFYALPFDYDGDGRTDASVFRPSTNEWHIAQSSGGIRLQGWGIANDKIAPADFDGDGKTDIAVFRPSEGNWYVVNSSNNTVTVAGWGNSTDQLVPGDYNGDGKADFVIYRPSEGRWYRRDTDGQVHVQDWGLVGDKPAPADFDGDGRLDLTVFRPGDGRWHTIRSSDFVITATDWGVSGDVPVAADYSGDGKADFVVFRPSDLTWYRRHTDDNSLHFITWGLAGDFPVPGDYDGDGKTDLAVFRPSNSTWFIFGSQAGIYSQGFGLQNDLPTPNAFLY